MTRLEMKRAAFSSRTLNWNTSWTAFLFLLLLVTVKQIWAVDPNMQISQYAHTSWRMQDGIFGGAPRALTQTTDGYLWIGTQGGLFRFDGVRFVQWTPPDGSHLPSSAITALLGSRDGSLWIGTASGLSRWFGQKLVNYFPDRGRVTALFEDHKGTIWTTQQRSYDTDGPLCQVIDGATTMRCYREIGDVPISLCCANAIAEDLDDNLWIGTDTTLFRWGPGSSSSFAPDGLKSHVGAFGIGSVVAAKDGSIFFGAARSGPDLGLQRRAQGRWGPVTLPGLNTGTLLVMTLLLDRHNSLWIGTANQGVYRVRDNKVDHFGVTDGLSNNYVVQFLEDRENNLWVVTRSGIDSFRDFHVASFTKREGLTVNEVDSVLASRDGTVWIGGDGALDSFRQGTLSSLQSRKGLPGNQVTSLLEDHVGQLWVGIDNTLSIYKNNDFLPISRPDGSPLGMVTGMTEDVNDNIWAEVIGPPRTLFRIRDHKVQDTFSVPKMPAARKVAADPTGGIWLGLMSGDLARYRGGKLDVFTFPHSPDPFVQQLIVNPDGSVLGAAETEVIGWKSGVQRTLTAKNGLPCDGAFALTSDERSNLWLYTRCGLIQIPSAEVQRWWEHSDASLSSRTFDVFDGAQPAWVPFDPIARTPDGRLWFANELALQMIDPVASVGNTVPPPVHVEELIADRKSYVPKEGLRLPALVRNLEINYTALSFTAPQKVRFRYKLEGHDVDWQEPGNRRQAFYTDLSPGAYRFHVIACNNDGLWNNTGASIDFYIAPAWFQTFFFRTSCFALSALAIWTLYRIRVRQITASINARSSERMAERARLARELHDTLLQTIQGSKMVADDALSESTNPIQIRAAMERLSDWLGRATAEGRAALNSLRGSPMEQSDLAKTLQQIPLEFLVKESMQVAFSLSGLVREIDPIVGDEICRIGHEAIRNACQHSGGSLLNVELAYAKNLILRVVDNGTGMDQATSELGKEGHFGLRGMRERAARIGATFDLVSSAATGTRITLSVPGVIAFLKPKETLSQKLVRFFEKD